METLQKLPDSVQKSISSVEDEWSRTELRNTLLQMVKQAVGQESAPNQETLTSESSEEMVDSIAKDYAEVFNSNPDRYRGIDRRDIWQEVLEKQSQEVLAAHAEQDPAMTKILDRYITTLSLVKASGPQPSLLELIRSGLGESIVESCQRLEGQVFVEEIEAGLIGEETEIRARSVIGVLEPIKPLLEICTGKKIDDLTDGKIELLGEMNQDEYIERIDTLDYSLACLAAKELSEKDLPAREREVLLDRASRRALQQLENTEMTYNNPEKLAEMFITLTDANPRILDNERFTAEFSRIRAGRMVGNHYRNNSKPPRIYDELIVGLVALDRPELATRLVTANAAELETLARVAHGFIKNKVGKFASVYYELTEDGTRIDYDRTQKDILAVLAPIAEISEKKHEQLGHTLSGLFEGLKKDDLSETEIERIKKSILATEDPERVIFELFPVDSVQFIDSQILLSFFSKPTHEVNESIPSSEKLVAFAEIQACLPILKQLGLEYPHYIRAILSDTKTAVEIRKFLPVLLEFHERIKGQPFDSTKTTNIIDAILSTERVYKDPGKIKSLIGIFNQSAVQDAIAERDGGFIMSLLENDNIPHILEQPNLRNLVLSTENPKLAERVLYGLSGMNDLTRITSLESLLNGDMKTLASEKPELFSRLLQNLVLSEDIDARWEELKGLVKSQYFYKLVVDEKHEALGDILVPQILASNEPVETCDKLEKNTQSLLENPFFSSLLNNTEYAALSRTLVPQIINSPEPAKTCEHLERIFLTPQPLWKSLYAYTETIIGFGPEKAHVNPGHIVTEVVKVISSSKQATSSEHYIESVRGFRPISFAKLTVVEKRAFGNDQFNALSNEEIEATDSIKFEQLNDLAKKAIYARNIYETINRSRSRKYKILADQRNRIREAESTSSVAEGDLIHGTTAGALDGILINGNFPGESRGLQSRTDSYWFFTDLSVIGPGSPQQAINESISSRYGAGDDQVFLVYGRSADSWQYGQESRGGSDRHALIYGGIPSTELTGIVLGNPEHNLEAVKLKIIRNGFYIPIYDKDGRVLFSAEEYDQLCEDYNMTIEIVSEDIIDNSFKTEERLGSNEGSAYLLPTPEGPKRYYIKFNDSDPDHIWTEWLGDEIYRILGIPTPDTRVVLVEGRVGHASRWIEEAEVDTSTPRPIEDGFIADCLLANWDAVYNPANNLNIGGVVFRVDAGGSLDYRARGEVKTPDQWGESVQEIGVGSDLENLGSGMRQMYPDLTEAQIQTQVATLREKLSDPVIDSLVDSIQRPKAEREALKRTLKARRDYILEQFRGADPI